MSKSNCEHSWYQEGQGEGAVRCCRKCGLIGIARDPVKTSPEIDLSPTEADALRRRAGVPSDVMSRLASSGDLNQDLLKLRFQRRFFGFAAVISVPLSVGPIRDLIGALRSGDPERTAIWYLLYFAFILWIWYSLFKTMRQIREIDKNAETE